MRRIRRAGPLLSRPRARLALAGLALLALDQALLFGFLADGEALGTFVAPFDPPLFTDVHRRSFERVSAAARGDAEARAHSLLDPELGWCPRPDSRTGPSRHDWSGSRIGLRELPRERADGVPRVCAVGGSFTQGAEVQGHETWLARIEALVPELEVANLGVQGYGLDQAYLRFRRDGARLAADEVWFGLMPEACLRITTHYPPALSHWASVALFKPRFRLRGDALELVPNPAPDHASCVRLVTDQRAFVAALGETDDWVRRAPGAWAPRGSHPAHWLGAGRLALTLLERGGRAREPRLEEPGDDVYRLARALLLALRDEARAAGGRLRIVVVPSRPDLESAERRGRRFWRPLLDDLAREGVDAFDAADALLAAGALEDDGLWAPGAHYSPEANRVVGEALRAAWLP